MTWLEMVLGLLLLVAGVMAGTAQRRYRALRRKHQLLQRLYERAEQQLTTLWAGKKP